MKVWYDHEVIGEHPARSEARTPEDGSLIVIEPGGRMITYEPLTWHAAGEGAICAFLEPRDDCPHCHPELAR